MLCSSFRSRLVVLSAPRYQCCAHRVCSGCCLRCLLPGINVVLIVFVLAAGFPHVKTANYVPFAPFGVRGIFTGASVVYFSFIG